MTNKEKTMAKKEGSKKEQQEKKQKSCFIIMPVTTPEELYPQYGGDKEHFTHVLECLFVPAINNADFVPIPPIAQGADNIPAEIIKNLETSDLVLCDISSLNPNVFFELGIRTALNKPVALVRDNYTKRIPFDTNTINHFNYRGGLDAWKLKTEIKDLSEHISKCYQRSDLKNSLWKYFGLTSMAQPAEKGSLEDKVDLVLKEMAKFKRKDEAIDGGTYLGDRGNEIESIINSYGIVPDGITEDSRGNVSIRFAKNTAIHRTHPLIKVLTDLAKFREIRIELIFGKNRIILE